MTKERFLGNEVTKSQKKESKSKELDGVKLICVGASEGRIFHLYVELSSIVTSSEFIEYILS